MKKFSIILAIDEKNWLWKWGDLAWKIPWDMKYFRETTSKIDDLAKYNAVVMWRKTWESIPSKFRPLPDRINCILSRTLKYEDMHSKIDNFVLHFKDFDNCLTELSERENVENIFVIGWANIYNQVLNHPNLEKIYITKVLWNFNCDVFFDWVPSDFHIKSYTDEEEENGVKYRFEVWGR